MNPLFQQSLGRDGQRWLPCRNVSGEAAPAFAVMVVVGWDDEEGCLEVDKPDTDNATCDVVVNGRGKIPAGGYGVCTRDFPTRMRRDGSFTTGACGVKASEWQMFSTMAGFLAEGGEESSSSSVMGTRCL